MCLTVICHCNNPTVSHIYCLLFLSHLFVFFWGEVFVDSCLMEEQQPRTPTRALLPDVQQMELQQQQLQVQQQYLEVQQHDFIQQTLHALEAYETEGRRLDQSSQLVQQSTLRIHQIIGAFPPGGPYRRGRGHPNLRGSGGRNRRIPGRGNIHVAGGPHRRGRGRPNLRVAGGPNPYGVRRPPNRRVQSHPPNRRGRGRPPNRHVTRGLHIQQQQQQNP